MPGAGTECRAGALREQFLVSLLCSSFPTLERRLRYNITTTKGSLQYSSA